MEIKVKRLDKGVELPDFAHEHDAAVDLRSAEEGILHPMEKRVFKTGLAFAIPKGYAGLVWDRSGMAAKHSIHTMAGVIDAGYRGEIGIVLINLGKEPFKIEKGMRIAQLLFHPILNVKIQEAEELDETSRGEGGFGSTGLH
ncbi:dUTP diphosphatase [Candidatus Woesearchaeota archaeon]|nr:dUTP diphosphatase [Candidatus Woesearchaeota archaeon]